MGGLSGCTYDENRHLLLAISDDRSEKGPARIYEFNVDFSGPQLSITPKNHLILQDEKDRNFAKAQVDFEGIAHLKNGNLLLISEGNGELSPRLPPSLMLFNSKGKRIKEWKLPPYLIPEPKGKQKTGARNNLAFEALTQIPNTDRFALISEQALIQDGPETGNDDKSPTRFFLMENEQVHSSYVYETDSFKQILGESVFKGTSGVSEALALNDKEFLVLERSFFYTTLKSRIRLFKTTIEKESTDISNWESLKGKKYIPLKKELLVDFNEFLPKLDAKYSALDNIEAMCWGPQLKNKKRSLIFISDNNFSIFQRTLFIILEVSADL